MAPKSGTANQRLDETMSLKDIIHRQVWSPQKEERVLKFANEKAELLDEALQSLRQDPALGRNTCSYLNECWEDDEILAELACYLVDHPESTKDQLMAWLQKIEKLYWEQKN